MSVLISRARIIGSCSFGTLCTEECEKNLRLRPISNYTSFLFNPVTHKKPGVILYRIIYNNLLYYIISYHIIKSYHISYNIISCPIICHIRYHIIYIISYHIISYIMSYIVTYRITSYHIVSHLIISYDNI